MMGHELRTVVRVDDGLTPLDVITRRVVNVGADVLAALGANIRS